jgi:Threonine aldolase
MYSFKNDYSEGAHPRILEALVETNLVQAAGYGEDQYCLKAIDLIKKRLGRSEVAVHLLSGGTQTNLTAISAFLRPHEAAIAATSGHIAVHETGAIESTGHKVITVNTKEGKLTPSNIKPALDSHTDEHMVKPRLVYISNSTEIGTVYTKDELTELSKFCKENSLILYMDGARLGSALCSEGVGLTLSDIPDLVDAFYIGGTKNGALLGEALVICNDSLKEDFRYFIKQKGGLLAKGRVMGIQFLELFKDGLFFELAGHANEMAKILKDGISKAGYTFLTDSPSNQIFPIFPNSLVEKLEDGYSFEIWSKIDDSHSAIRLVTSWATEKSAVLAFIADMKKGY